jgi:hypothetical protein
MPVDAGRLPSRRSPRVTRAPPPLFLSFRGPDHLARIQAEAQTIVSDAFKAAGV